MNRTELFWTTSSEVIMLAWLWSHIADAYSSFERIRVLYSSSFNIDGSLEKLHLKYPGVWLGIITVLKNNILTVCNLRTCTIASCHLTRQSDENFTPGMSTWTLLTKQCSHNGGMASRLAFWPPPHHVWWFGCGCWVFGSKHSGPCFRFSWLHYFKITASQDTLAASRLPNFPPHCISLAIRFGSYALINLGDKSGGLF